MRCFDATVRRCKHIADTFASLQITSKDWAIRSTWYLSEHGGDKDAKLAGGVLSCWHVTIPSLVLWKRYASVGYLLHYSWYCFTDHRMYRHLR